MEIISAKQPIAELGAYAKMPPSNSTKAASMHSPAPPVVVSLRF